MASVRQGVHTPHVRLDVGLWCCVAGQTFRVPFLDLFQVCLRGIDLILQPPQHVFVCRRGDGRRVAVEGHGVTDLPAFDQVPLRRGTERCVMHLAVEAGDDDVFGARSLVGLPTVENDALDRSRCL